MRFKVPHQALLHNKRFPMVNELCQRAHLTLRGFFRTLNKQLTLCCEKIVSAISFKCFLHNNDS